MKPYVALFLTYTILNVLAIPLYYIAIVTAAFAADSGTSFYSYFIIFLAPFIVNLLILPITLFIKKISITSKQKLKFFGIYLFAFLILYTIFLFEEVL